MITMRLTQHDGTEVAEADWNGRTIRVQNTLGAPSALARLLIAAGAADQPWQATGAQGGGSLHTLAASTSIDGDNGNRTTWWSRRPLHATAS